MTSECPIILIISNQEGKGLVLKRGYNGFKEKLAACTYRNGSLQCGENYLARKFTSLGHKTKLINAQFVNHLLKLITMIVRLSVKQFLCPLLVFRNQYLQSAHREKSRLIQKRTAFNMGADKPNQNYPIYLILRPQNLRAKPGKSHQYNC